MRVLVVDDNKAARRSIIQLLTNRDLEIAGEAATGQQAVDLYFELNPDLVTVDLRMPKMDGITAIRLIRERAPEAKIIALTSVDDEAIIRLANEAGAANYLVKPVNPKELAEVVSGLVGIEEVEPDPADNGELLTIFVEEATDHTGRLIKSAVNLRKDRGDLDAIDVVYRSSHMLKGMTAILGFGELSELASALEKLAKARVDSKEPFSTRDLQNLVRGIDSIRKSVEGVEGVEVGHTAEPPSSALAGAIERSLIGNRDLNDRRMTGKSVLIVDDDGVTRQSLRTILSREGLDVMTAPDGESGLRLAQARRPHLIVLDLVMPRMGGGDVCQQLRKDPSTRKSRVLMLTSREDLETKLKGFDVGTDDYVTNPFDPEELAARARALISKRRRRKAG